MFDIVEASTQRFNILQTAASLLGVQPLLLCLLLLRRFKVDHGSNLVIVSSVSLLHEPSLSYLYCLLILEKGVFRYACRSGWLVRVRHLIGLRMRYLLICKIRPPFVSSSI